MSYGPFPEQESIRLSFYPVDGIVILFEACVRNVLRKSKFHVLRSLIALVGPGLHKEFLGTIIFFLKINLPLTILSLLGGHTTVVNRVLGVYLCLSYFNTKCSKTALVFGHPKTFSLLAVVPKPDIFVRISDCTTG